MSNSAITSYSKEADHVRRRSPPPRQASPARSPTGGHPGPTRAGDGAAVGRGEAATSGRREEAAPERDPPGLSAVEPLPGGPPPRRFANPSQRRTLVSPSCERRHLPPPLTR